MQQPYKRYYPLILCLLIGFFGGCSWHLRGTGEIPDNLDSLHITARNPSDELVRDLRQTILAHDIALPAHASEASYNLVILDQRSTRHVAALNVSARAAEYRLVEEVDFLILSPDGRQLTPPTTASSERIFEFNEDDVLARDEEEQQLKREMRGDLIRQIINRLHFASTTQDDS